jgi:hypothetical protein
MTRADIITLAVRSIDALTLSNNVLLADDGELPAEFRIFARGENQTTKGTFVFDERAAADVMAAFAEHMKAGAQGLMIDLEHLSLDSESRNFDPDARGWARLELRGGELWATQVKWTDDGARRLTEKTQRFISPAFARDPETRRITKVINVAITALPATDQLTPLIAANSRGDQMDELKAALGLAEDASAEDVLNAIGALKTKLTDTEAKLAKLQDGLEDEDEETKGNAAVAEAARAATGKTKADEVKAGLVALSATRDANTDVQAELATLRAASEARDVRDLVRENTAKIPKTLEAWALAQTPDALKVYLKDAPTVRTRPAVELAVDGDDAITLTDEDRQVATQLGIDPAKFLESKKADAKAARDAAAH